MCPERTIKNLERVTRLELATLCLGSRHSTTELHPLGSFHFATEVTRTCKRASKCYGRARSKVIEYELPVSVPLTVLSPDTWPNVPDTLYRAVPGY